MHLLFFIVKYLNFVTFWWPSSSRLFKLQITFDDNKEIRKRIY